MHKALINRAFSGFPVSIATGMALETLFEPVQPVYDDSREVPKKVNLKDYNNYIFNVSTLLRNLLNSLPSSEILLIPKKDILDTLLDEITFISELFQMENLNINFYINNYQYVKDTYDKENILRKPTTDKQLIIENIMKYCLDFISKHDDVTLFTKSIKYKNTDQALLLSHIAWDLLSYDNFIKLDLLESHTGVIKSRKLWNSKYYPLPDHDMSFLPFMEYLLVKFGCSNMFKPAPLKERIELWNSIKKKPGINPLYTEKNFLFSLGSNNT